MSTDTRNTSDTTISDTAEDRALKAKHAAMWASGSYPTVVDDVVAELGGLVVDAVDVGPGQHVLDVAAGTGTSALPAARRGAHVTATDLTPELLDVGRADAAREGLDSTWRTVDAEALPYPDHTFDVVLSAIGVMFAPHHQLAADELIRVCRPGGTIAVLNWTPEGFIGQVFAAMKAYAPRRRLAHRPLRCGDGPTTSVAFSGTGSLNSWRTSETSTSTASPTASSSASS